MTVTVGGAVEGVRGRAVVPRASPGDENEDNKGLAATKTSCAFGAVAPVAARAAGGASSRDVTCVSPATRPGALAPLRVFAGAAVTAPPSPRARAAHGAGDAASFRADPEGRATAAMRSLSLGAASAREPSALVVGWGLRPLDACAHGAADRVGMRAVKAAVVEREIGEGAATRQTLEGRALLCLAQPAELARAVQVEPRQGVVRGRGAPKRTDMGGAPKRPSIHCQYLHIYVPAYLELLHSDYLP